MLIYGTEDWIERYLLKNNFSFYPEYPMGEKHYEVEMTNLEFKRMKKTAESLENGTHVDVFFDTDLSIKNTFITYLSRIARKMSRKKGRSKIRL